MFKNLNNLTQLLKSAGSMGERVKEMRAELGSSVVTGSAAENKIQVEVTGLGEVRKLNIDPSLMTPAGESILEELIPVALNEALTKVRKMHVEKMREATGGISLPGLDEALANL